jgi:hypothetical protein
MPIGLILVLAAAAAFALIAGWRLYRIRADRDPLPGWLRIVVGVLMLVVTPIALQTAFGRTSGPGSLDLASGILLYVVAFVVIWLAMIGGSVLVARFAPAKQRQTLLLAMVGRDTSGMVPFDPPMSAALADSVEQVDRLNAEFPRGPAFIGQIGTPGFRPTWDALDDATRTLEGQIAEQRRLGLGISEHAVNSAADARSRLDALRQAAQGAGQPWATA